MTTITADLTTGFRVEMRAGNNTWVADEPVELGGTDTGPSPYELLLGALAACTLLTLRIVADREGIPVEHISASFEYDRVHADDCAVCPDDATGFLDHVTSKVFIDGTFDERQKARLERVAGRCPVHRTLEAGLVFDEQVIAG